MSTAEQPQFAILVANVVGYDRLRKVNATGAGDRLDRVLRTVARIASDRGGRLLSGADDAALEVALSNPVDAATAAIEIQGTFAEYNAECSASEHLQCGIGVAFGQALIEEQGLCGDAVLLARELMRRARPGTTIISEALFTRIRPHLHFSYRRSDQSAFEGLSGPVEAYQIKKAPPDGGRPRRRPWLRLGVRPVRDLNALDKVALASPAPASPRWLTAAGLALAVLALGAITAITYEHWGLVVAPESMVSADAEKALPLEADRIPDRPQPKPITAAPSGAGPSSAVSTEEAPPPAERQRAPTVERGTVLAESKRPPQGEIEALQGPLLPEREPSEGGSTASAPGSRTPIKQTPATLELGTTEGGGPVPVDAFPVSSAASAPPQIEPEATTAAERSAADSPRGGTERGSVAGPSVPDAPAATEEQAAETAPDRSPGAGGGLSLSSAITAVRTLLFGTPEPRVAEPKAPPMVAEVPSGGDHHPDSWDEITSAPPAKQDGAEPPAADKRSIVVMPFTNPGGDPARNYFNDGVTETLINSLTRFPHLKVIANESAVAYKDQSADLAQIGKDLGVRYILNGTATRTSDDLVITAQLIDTSAGAQTWNSEYDVSSSDPSTAQRMLIQRVLFSLDGRDPKSVPAEGFGFEPVGTVSLDAYDYALQWRSLFNKSTEADNVRAREAALRAVEMDPGYAAAYAFVAWTYMADYWRGWTSDQTKPVQQALQWATRALDHDPRDYNAHWALGDVYQALGEYDKSVAAYETALAINPEVAALLEDFGTWMLPLRGRAKEGVALTEKAMALNPHHPDYYYGDIAFNYYLLNAYDQAIRSVERVAQPRLDHRLYLAASYAQANRSEEAKLEIAKILEGQENLTVEEFLATYPFKDETDREHLRVGLQEAGLPTGRIN